MKKTFDVDNTRHSFLWAFLVLLLLSSGSSCYAQDNLNESEMIEFNYTTKTLNKVLPFDEQFSIKLVDIPKNKGIDSIYLRLYEYDIKKFKFKNGQTITPSDLKDWLVVYVTEQWKRSDAEETNGEITILYKLKPNRKYVVEIGSPQRKELNAIEKAALTTDIKNNKQIQDLIKNTADKLLAAPIGIPNYGSLDVTQEEFNRIARQVVAKTNKDYQVGPIDLADHLSKLTTFVNTLNEAKEVVNLLPASEPSIAAEKRVAYTTSVAKFKTLLGQINWGTAAEEDLKKLTEDKVKIFDGATDAIVLAQKARLETFITNILTQRNDWLNTIAANTIVNKVYKVTTLGATYRADFVKNAKTYITLDLGSAYVGNMDRVVAYSGVNIYLRPVNKNVPFSDYSFYEQLLVRSSLLIGLTLNSIEKTNIRKGLIGNGALVLGAGIRIVPFMKINGGGMIYYKYSNNPLISHDRYRTTVSPFVSISIDLDAKSLFAGVGEAMFK